MNIFKEQLKQLSRTFQITHRFLIPVIDSKNEERLCLRHRLNTFLELSRDSQDSGFQSLILEFFGLWKVLVTRIRSLNNSVSIPKLPYFEKFLGGEIL